jgi:hypothetical protein
VVPRLENGLDIENGNLIVDGLEVRQSIKCQPHLTERDFAC